MNRARVVRGADSLRPRTRWLLTAIMLVASVMATSGLYLLERTHREASGVAGPTITEIGDDSGVAAYVRIRTFDATAGTVTADVTVTPLGSLADDNGDFSQDTTIRLSSYRADPIVAAKGRPLSVEEHRFAITGTEMDYPLDRYAFDIWFQADRADRVPTRVSLYVDDGADLFSLRTSDATSTDDVTGLDLVAARTVPTMVFAGFVMLLMFGLAVAASIACHYVLRRHRGLLFPACSMLAAMVFALPSLRHQVPGDPPMGALIDFVAYFPSQATIAISLIAAVLGGFRLESHRERAD